MLNQVAYTFLYGMFNEPLS